MRGITNHIIIFRLPLSLISLTVLVSSVLLKFLIIRFRHSSWDSPSGLMLLGGWDSRNTSEKIKNGTSSASFDLKYSTS